MIVLNFVLFLLIAVGQTFIYWSVRSNSISSSKKTGSRDATIARRLTTIVLSDFLCWFPIGLLGELIVAVAIFILPFNSELNPFLYTFNVLMEKRQKAQEAYLLKRLESRMHTEQTQADASLKIALPVNRSTAVDLIKAWLIEQVLTPADIVSCSAAICDGGKGSYASRHLLKKNVPPRKRVSKKGILCWTLTAEISQSPMYDWHCRLVSQYTHTWHTFS